MIDRVTLRLEEEEEKENGADWGYLERNTEGQLKERPPPRRPRRSWPQSSDDRSHFLSSSLPSTRESAAEEEPFVSPIQSVPTLSVARPAFPSPPFFFSFAFIPPHRYSCAALATTMIEEMMLSAAAAIMMEVHINANE